MTWQQHFSDAVGNVDVSVTKCAFTLSVHYSRAVVWNVYE